MNLFFSLKEKWNLFWFENGSTRALCLLRIAFGITLLMKLTNLYGLSRFPNYNIQIPKRVFKTASSYYLTGFHLPVDGFDWLPVLSFNQWQGLELAILLLCFFFILGLGTRWVGPLLALSYLYTFLISQFLYHHHIFLFCIVLLVLAFSSCADHYSIDAWIRALSKRPLLPSQPVMPLRMIQCLVSFIYLMTALSKTEPSWLNGQFIDYLQIVGRINGNFAPFLIPYLPPALLGFFTVLAEYFLAFALWVPILRPWGFLVGIALHVGIDLLMPVSTYGVQMLALYLAFVEKRERRA